MHPKKIIIHLIYYPSPNSFSMLPSKSTTICDTDTRFIFENHIIRIYGKMITWSIERTKLGRFEAYIQ